MVKVNLLKDRADSSQREHNVLMLRMMVIFVMLLATFAWILYVFAKRDVKVTQECVARTCHTVNVTPHMVNGQCVCIETPL